MSPSDKDQLAKRILQALAELQEARRLAPDDAQLRGAVILLKRVLVGLDCWKG